MFDFDKMRNAVVYGMSRHLGVPVIRFNQNAEPPKYPYIGYSVTIFADHKGGTFGIYKDKIARKPFKQTWSFKALSNDYSESCLLARKARLWLEYDGRVYLKDNDCIVNSLTNITDRSSILTVEYEYSHGFDAVFWCMEETEITPGEQFEEIESVTINGETIRKER